MEEVRAHRGISWLCMCSPGICQPCVKDFSVTQETDETLFVRRQRLRSVGGFSLLLLHCLSHVQVRDMTSDSSPAFQRLFFKVTPTAAAAHPPLSLVPNLSLLMMMIFKCVTGPAGESWGIISGQTFLCHPCAAGSSFKHVITGPRGFFRRGFQSSRRFQGGRGSSDEAQRNGSVLST